MTKEAKKKAYKLDIKTVLANMDRKNRDYYDSLSEEEQKQLATFLLIRWGSSVDGDPMLQHYYLAAVNERLNKNFFDISTKEHKKLQWLLATTVSPGMGVLYHPWISNKGSKKSKTGYSKELIDYFKEQYPTYDDADIDLLLTVNTEEQIKQFLYDMGIDNKTIKAMMKRE